MIKIECQKLNKWIEWVNLFNNNINNDSDHGQDDINNNITIIAKRRDNQCQLIYQLLLLTPTSILKVMILLIRQRATSSNQS